MKINTDMTYCATNHCDMRPRCQRAQNIPENSRPPMISYTLFKPMRDDRGQFYCEGLKRTPPYETQD